MENLKTVSALVKNILEHDHKARNTDNHLYLMVLEHYSGLRGIDIHAMTVPVFLKELDRRSFPGFETVRRSRQKVQATYPDLAPSEAVGKRRAKNEVVYREFAESRGVKKMTWWITDTSIGQRLKFVRRFRRLTQKELGLLMGYSEKTADVRIAQYEKNARTPNAETTAKLAEVLKVSPVVFSPTICASREDLLQSMYWLFLMKGGGDIYDCETEYARSRMEQKLGVITVEEFLEKILVN